MTPLTVMIRADLEQYGTNLAAVSEVLKRVATSAQMQVLRDAAHARERRSAMHAAYRAKTRRRK